VKQLARLSAVSTRTLHYYDEIGLLKPAEVGANGYRYYGRAELLRLQQILLHRELGMPLDSIAALLDTSDRQRIERLQEYRQLLLQRISRHHEIIATLDMTIASLKGENRMDESNLYRGFSPEKQAGYEEWLVQRCPDERSQQAMREDIARSRKKVAAFTPEDMAASSRRLAELEGALAEHCRKGTPAGDAALQPLLDGHREWVAGMWGKPCPPGAYAGLADLYESHPDFRARYEAQAPGFADYLPTAMRAYARSFSISAGSS
jgi:DNA-binding transcriptional MerR regulator